MPIARYDTESFKDKREQLFADLTVDSTDAVYIQISESCVGRALRTGRYKYVVCAPDKNPWDESGSGEYKEKYLFDLQEDPLEKNNLIADPVYREIREELRARLLTFAETAGEHFEIPGWNLEGNTIKIRYFLIFLCILSIFSNFGLDKAL